MKKSKKIAIAAIASAGAAIFLVLGNTISLLDYSFYLLASLCVMLPFMYGDFWGAVAVFAVSSVIGFITVPNVMVMFSYLIFFAPYMLLSIALDLKKVKKIVYYPIISVFFALAIFLMYKFTTLFVDINSVNLPLFVLFILAFVVLIIYDFMMTNIRRQAFRIIKRLIEK